ncbi:MAG TPA: zf-HC2 domain-containing protein [Gemmatimonadales bacterium]|nr:zf-HC2 domain-containing protein [Gemmatimonadales bacterium]
MNDLWTNRLSEYLDDELDSAERAALEAHLKTCGACYATLTELRQVVAHAKSLENSEPATDLWPGIRERLTAGRRPGVSRDTTSPRRRFSFTVPQLLAASIALVLLSGGGMWLATRQQPVNTAVTRPRPTITAVANWTNSTDAAIADLQAALVQNEKRLDTTTVRIVRKNLAVIDRAIAEARMALRSDPGNAYLNLHLADTMRRKVELLRRVNEIAAARS